MIKMVFWVNLEGFRSEGLDCSFVRDSMLQLRLTVRLACLEKLLMEYDEY